MNRILILSCFILFLNSNNAVAQKMEIVENHLNIFIGNSKQAHLEIDLNLINVENQIPKIKQKLGTFNYKFKKHKKIEILGIDNKSNSVLVKTNQGKISIHVDFSENSTANIKFANDFGANYWQIPVKMYEEEIWFGGGVQFSNVILNNQKINNLSEENGIGRGDKGISKWTNLIGVKGESYSSYSPQAYAVSSLGRSLKMKGYHYTTFDFSDNNISIKTYQNEANLELKTATTFQTLVKQNNAKFDAPYPIPDWALGNILGLQGGSEKVMSIVDKMLTENCDIDAVWIQDWIGKRKTTIGSRLQWQWKIDRNSYPDFEIFRDVLNAKKIKLLGYINPFFDENGPYTLEGIEKNYLVSKNGKALKIDYGGMKGYMLDIFNQEAYNWMKSIIQENLVENGFSGWMADFAEWYPIFEKELENLPKNMAFHNEFPVLWAKLNHEIIQENKDKELFFFNRSGNEKTEKYSSIMWAGDQTVDFGKNDGLPSVFKAMLSSSFSGFNVMHSDIGGYTSIKNIVMKNIIRDKKVMLEWMKLEAFTPVFRSHEGLHPEANLQVYSNDESIKNYKIWSDIHKKLIPYFQEIIQTKHSEGQPLYIHPAYFNEKNVQQNGESLFVGKDIFITYGELNKNTPQGSWMMINDEGQISTNASPEKSKEFKVKILIRENSDVHKMLE